MTTVGSLVRLTMNPPVSSMVAGDPATGWRRIAAMAIAQPVKAAAHLFMLIDPRLLHARCRLFHRIRVLAARDRVDTIGFDASIPPRSVLSGIVCF
jgi:hypothetical protein